LPVLAGVPDIPSEIVMLFPEIIQIIPSVNTPNYKSAVFHISQAFSA
jgi:hypothetical protein